MVIARHCVSMSFSKCGRVIYLSKGAMKDFLLADKMKLTFVIDVGRLYFYINKDDKTGFPIFIDEHQGGRIFSRLLVVTIYTKLPSAKRNGPKFNVRYSNTRINDCATFEILIHNKI